MIAAGCKSTVDQEDRTTASRASPLAASAWMRQVGRGWPPVRKHRADSASAMPGQQCLGPRNDSLAVQAEQATPANITTNSPSTVSSVSGSTFTSSCNPTTI